MNILLAGDNFVRNDLLEAAIVSRLTSRPRFSYLSLPWPEVPFGRVAEVDEASDCEDALAAAIVDAEVVVTQMAPLTARVIDEARGLRLILCTRGGPVNVNLEAAAARGVLVSISPGRNAVAAAEYTLALMLAAMRRLPAAHASMVAGAWRSDWYAYDQCGTEVAGSTVGIIGFGEIGRRVAAGVQGLGGKVLVYDPFVAPESVDASVEVVSLAALLERASVVSLHARLTPQTRGMIGASEIARMRPGTVLVNTARGGLLDYEAAVAALHAGHLGALAVDVYPEEPVGAGSPILAAPHVMLSPHLAGATRQTALRAAAVAAEELERYALGQPLRHVVNGVDLVAGAAR